MCQIKCILLPFVYEYTHLNISQKEIFPKVQFPTFFVVWQLKWLHCFQFFLINGPSSVSSFLEQWISKSRILIESGKHKLLIRVLNNLNMLKCRILLKLELTPWWFRLVFNTKNLLKKKLKSFFVLLFFFQLIHMKLRDRGNVIFHINQIYQLII